MTARGLMMQLDEAMCEVTTLEDLETEAIKDWLGRWNGRGDFCSRTVRETEPLDTSTRNLQTELKNRYLVLAGWSEHGSFPSFSEARKSQMSLEDKFPKMKFDIWIDFNASGYRMKIIEGRLPLEDSKACAWRGIRDWRQEPRKRGVTINECKGVQR